MDDFTNDGEFDPDLEARLYGEIYYSNDTYAEPPLGFWNNSTLDKRVDQSYIPRNNYSNNNHARNNRVVDSTSYVRMTNPPLPKRFHNYRSSSSTSNRENLPSYQCSTSFSRSRNHQGNLSNGDYSNHYRNYYCPPFDNDYRRPSYKRTHDYQQVVATYKTRRSNYSRNLSEKSSTLRRRRPNYSRTPKTREVPRVSPQKEKSSQKSVDSVVEIIDEVIDGNNENSDVVDNNTSTNVTTSVVNDESTASNNNNKNENTDNEANTIHHCSDTSSKYDVKEKQKQVDLSDVTNMDNDTINCSDSEESIFEVPVPPKPKPPLIDLQDSDDSSDAEEIEEDEKEEEDKDNPIVVENIDESTSDSLPVDLNSNVQNNTPTVDSTNIDNIEKEFTDPNIDENNIILNCVALQKCASSLGDIKRIREAAIVSDDSMTDSEALNWGTIEGQIVQDKQPIPDDDSNHGHFNINYFEKSHTDERIQDISETASFDKTPTRKSTQVSNPKPPESISEPTNLLESPSCSKDSQDINIVINCNISKNTVEIQTSSPTTRSEKNKKRPHRSIENENNVNLNNHDHQEASTSTKKSRTFIKSTADMSFEEYVFQPMSEKLKEYYSTFRGEEFMDDVSSIQNQMPKNPSRWAILDVDLFGPRRWDKHLRCAICQHFGHKKEKCPAYKQVIVCYMCGEHGHTEPRCPHKMCLTCGTKYSTYRKTCENCRNLVCTTCKAQGHSSTSCPDLWRRFHQTTESYTVNVPSNPEGLLKTPNKLACCNCAKRGHESTTCQRYRWSQHFPTPRFVTNYDQPPFYTPNSEIPESTEPGEILYHDTNYSTNMLPIEWVTEEIYPHTLSGVSYSFTEEYLPTPAYLKKHIPSDVYYDITISRLLNSSNCVFIVKSINNELLCGIKKLIIQWLQRTPEDRSLMDSTAKLPVMQMDLIDNLNAKWKIFNRIRFKNASRWLEMIKNGEKELIEIEETEKSSGKNFNGMRQKILKKRLSTIKRRLLACTYRSFLFPGAANVLEQFPKLIDKLKKYPVLAPVPNDLYLSATWYNFELFIPHTSEYVLVAFKKKHGRQQNQFKVEKNKLKRKKDKQLSKNRDVQVIDLTETDQDTSINIIELNDQDNKTPECKSLKVKTLSEKNQNRTRNVRRRLKSFSNKIDNNEDHLNCQEQIKCAGEILKFVRKKNLKNFIKGANRLMKEAQMSLLKKEHIIHFWTLIRSSKYK